MTPERWQEIEAVLQAALDRPSLERNSFLEDACATDQELKEEVNSLISAYEEADDFIEQPAIATDAHVFVGSDSDLNIGREIGPYRIIERLGAGGMSEVYLAQDLRLGRRVALKLLPAYFAADDERLRRFQSEARAASALNHPNILTIYEVGENAGVYFIATEFIDGQTIRELIRKHELSVADVLDCVEQVASALAAAHAAGIVHRDIKPENIMRRPDGLVKILDFGIAKLMEPEAFECVNQTGGFRTHTEAGLVMGTANYMSPEQARALPVDERTDIWSLGVVLYEMLTHRLPFSGMTRMDTMVAILDREPAPLSRVAHETYTSAPVLESIVNKCLSKETSNRYRTVGDLLEELKEAREQLEIPPTKARSVPFASRWRWPILGVLALLLMATVGGFLYRRSVARRQPAIAVLLQTPASPGKLYLEMSERERLDFVSAQEHHISTMMSARAVKLNDDAVRVIKAHVDRYAVNMSKSSVETPGNVGGAYLRARPYVPVIARSFAARKVPLIIGIYLPVVESSFKECPASSFGTKGLYQFTPQTALIYGVAPEDMCDVEKMTPAAAHYIADLMAELGEDSGSVTLVLLSYNRGPEWVRSTLRQLRSTENYERNFWAVIVNRQTLDEMPTNESISYVPNFYAAAIVGENPQNFGLQTPPLSSLAGVSQ
jgi:serine/threonine protein kinase